MKSERKDNNHVLDAVRSRCKQFDIGQTMITLNALANLTQEDILGALYRHIEGDWGDLCSEDWHANETALVEQLRLLSAYRSQSGTAFWVITEADRNTTTVLLPEEY